MQFLIELGHEKAFGTIELTITKGQIGTIRYQQVFKPGELPVKDRGRIEHLRTAAQST